MKFLSHLFRLTVLAALLAGTALSARPATPAHAQGATLVVNTQNDDNPPLDDGYCSLREAITNANTNDLALSYDDCLVAGSATETDTILFAADPSIMTYIYLNSDLPEITDPAGLTINGGGMIVIHGQYLHRLFVVNLAPLTLESMNLFGGYAETGEKAGGVLNDGGTVTVTKSVFYFNQGINAGAIFNNLGILNVANSLFLENFNSNTSAQAVFTDGNATFTNNTFNKNGSASMAGADIYLGGGQAYLVNNIFANTQNGGHCIHSANATWTGHHNLFEDPSDTCGFTNVNGNILGVDPAFDPNIFYGIALSSTSPAIDRGDDTACANNTSINGLPRPQGPHCDIGAYEYPQTLVRKYVVSTASQDGWVLESTATSSVGGSRSSTGSTIPIGDTAQKQQRVGIFSFDLGAAGIPATQELAKVILALHPAGACGTTAPFASLGNLLVDARTGAFANDPALQAKDFQATATKKAAWSLDGTLTAEGWLAKELSLTDFQYLNRSGVTQIRVRFAKGNNSNARADCLKIYASEEPTHLVQPQLVVDYYIK